MNRAYAVDSLFKLVKELNVFPGRSILTSFYSTTSVANQYRIRSVSKEGFHKRLEARSCNDGFSFLRPEKTPLDACKSCRYMSRQMIQWERMRERRPLPPKDISAHYPDHISKPDPNQEANEFTKAITKETIEKVNEQIRDRSHGRLFAVVQVMGKQFKVTAEDIIIVQGYWAPQVGDQIRLEKILLAGSSDFTLIGRPVLPQDLMRIDASVIEKTLSFTKLHYILKPRKRFRKLRFFKIPYTMVRINSIEFEEPINQRKEVEGDSRVFV